MKLVTFDAEGKEKVGALRDHRIVDLRDARTLQLIYEGRRASEAIEQASSEIPDSMIEFIEGGEETLSIAKQAEEFAAKHTELGRVVYSMENVKLKAPIPKPPMVLNMYGSLYRPFPVSGFVYKNVTGMIGPFDTIVIPKEISDFGAVYECELALVIGKKGRRIPNDDSAFEHLYGYTVYNDVTDYGKQMKGIFNFKIYDTFCSIGPCIVTKDEIRDPYGLGKRAWVNGQLATDIKPRVLRKIPEFISFPSQTFSLPPGTVISTGAGNSGRLKDGDIVELEIEKIGRMRYPVVAE